MGNTTLEVINALKQPLICITEDMLLQDTLSYFKYRSSWKNYTLDPHRINLIFIADPLTGELKLSGGGIQTKIEIDFVKKLYLQKPDYGSILNNICFNRCLYEPERYPLDWFRQNKNYLEDTTKFYDLVKPYNYLHGMYIIGPQESVALMEEGKIVKGTCRGPSLFDICQRNNIDIGKKTVTGNQLDYYLGNLVMHAVENPKDTMVYNEVVKIDKNFFLKQILKTCQEFTNLNTITIKGSENLNKTEIKFAFIYDPKLKIFVNS